MILLDNILRYCLDDIFKGFFDYDALNAYSMKMTRDAEYDLVHEMEASLMELMSSSLKQRLTAEPVRFVYQRDMPNALVEVLREKLTISRYDSIVPGGRYHNFKDVYAIFGLIKPSSAMVLMPFANAMCCSIILITPLSTCWNCYVRRRSTRACWR